VKVNLIHDPIIEKSVLWYMLQPEINSQIISEAIQLFKTVNPFYTKLYRQAYDGIMELYGNEMAVNIETLDSYFFGINDVFLTPEEAEMLQDDEQWMDFLVTNPKDDPKYYNDLFLVEAQLLLDVYKRREMQRLGLQIQAANSTKADDLSVWIHSRLEELSELSRDEKAVDYSIRSLLKETGKTLDIITKNDGILGISTGFGDLDMYLSGIHVGEFTIIAGRPSMGKSTFADILAYHIAREHQKTAIISYEMDYASIIHKLIASETGIDSNEIRNGWVFKNPKLTKQYNEACLRITNNADNNLFILDNLSNDADVLAEKIKYLADKEDIKVFIIDHIQKMACKRVAKSGGNREQEMNAISGVLQRLSRKKDKEGKPYLSIIGLSQLSRSCESRPDKRPMLSDLRESGAIEQDADTVMFLYRDAVYSGDKADKSLEVIIAKQRNGATGTVFMYYDLPTSRITLMVK